MEPAIDGVRADHDPSAAVCSDRSAVGRFHSCRGGVALERASLPRAFILRKAASAGLRRRGNVVEPTDDERTNSLESFEASQGLHT